jgi:hypothetical protein
MELIFRVHAIKRMFERGVGVDDVHHVLKTGESIEEYADDKPFPSRLILGFVSSRPLHVVAAEDRERSTAIIITVYEPRPEQWDEDFRRRKES